MLLLLGSEVSKLCGRVEEINTTQHILLKKDFVSCSTTDLQEINYDPCLTPNSTSGNLYKLNNDKGEITCESKRIKTINGGYEMILTKNDAVNHNRVGRMSIKKEKIMNQK